MLKLKSVIETSIYVDDLSAAERFYATVLGLNIVAKEAGRHVFFQVGDSSMLLAFNPETTRKGDHLPHHGAHGPGHFAMGIEPQSYEAWKKVLQDHHVPIEQEIDWPRGGKSIYFRDPSGNSVELVTPGVWGLPSGW